MKILLDTHCWLWMLATPDRFGPVARELVVNSHNQLFLSAASSWEIAIKFALGKLELPAPPSEYVPSRMQVSGVVGLPVEHAHALSVSDLPPLHRDPFDRLLVAQAAAEGLSVLSADLKLAAYDVEFLPAGD